MKAKYRLLFFLIGVAGMVFLFIQMDSDNIPWQELFSLDTLLLFLGLFALWAVIYVVHTISYYIILGKDGKKIKFFSLLKICISGFALNSVTPAGLVGGEPYRIMELKRYTTTEKASSSTLTFSLFYVTGHILLWGTGSIIYFVYGAPGEYVISVILGLTGVFCLLFTLLFIATKRRGFVLPVIKFLAKLPLLKKPFKKLLNKSEGQFVEIDDNIKAFRQDIKKFISVLALQYGSRLLEAVEYMIILQYFGEKVGFLDGVLVLATASLIGNLIFFIPMQAGSREGGLYIALAFLGITESIGSIASIVYRVRDFICIFVGIMIILVARKHEGNSIKSTLESFVKDGEIKENSKSVNKTEQESK